MARLGVILKVMPKDPQVDLDDLESKIRSVVEVLKVEKKPIAFGLNALMVTVVIPDAEGGTDPLEAKIRGIGGVGEVSVETLSRLVE